MPAPDLSDGSIEMIPLGDSTGRWHFPAGPVDEHGTPVKRSKRDFPYSYDGFVLWRTTVENKGTAMWSDRLWQEDHQKTDRLWEKHCPGVGWGDVSAGALTAFLREWTGKEGLEVVLLMQYCNLASGYPVWRVDVVKDNPENGENTDAAPAD